MTDQQRRAVALVHDMARIRRWLDAAVARAVNEAAMALNSIRYWCDRQQAEIEACPLGHDPQLCPPCSARAYYVAEIRALLPALPEPNRRAESGEEVTGMAGTRVTRDRELPLNGGEDGDRGGSDSGN